MSQTILLEKDNYLAHLYLLNLQIFTGTDVVIKHSFDEIKEVLRVIPQVSLIICRDDEKGQKNIIDLTEYIKTNSLDVPIITFGNEIENIQNVAFLPDDCSLVEVVRTVAKILGVVPKELIKKIVPDFYPINIENFTYINKAGCDVFIKSVDSIVDYEFSKRVSKGEVFSSNLIQGCIDKGIKHLYVLKDERVKFVNSFSEQLIEKLDQKDLSFKERIKTTEKTFDLIRSGINFDEFCENDYILIQKTLQSVMTIISMEKPNLRSLIDDLIGMQSSYLFRNVVLTTYFSASAIRNSKWGLDSHLELLSYVSLLHDMTLETESQAKVRDQSDLDRLGENDEEKRIVLEHAYDVSQKAAQVDKLLPDVSIIILQHHGSPNGRGFPEDCAQNLHALSYLFMASEIYANEVMGETNEATPNDIIEKLRKKRINSKIWKYIELI